MHINVCFSVCKINRKFFVHIFTCIYTALKHGNYKIICICNTQDILEILEYYLKGCRGHHKDSVCIATHGQKCFPGMAVNDTKHKKDTIRIRREIFFNILSTAKTKKKEH